jgi:hypothetical protein
MHFHDFPTYSIQFDVGPQIHLLWPGRISRSFACTEFFYEFIIFVPRLVFRIIIVYYRVRIVLYVVTHVLAATLVSPVTFTAILHTTSAMINPTIILSMVEVYKYSNF